MMAVSDVRQKKLYIYGILRKTGREIDFLDLAAAIFVEL
jgi:hypothetical protein